jgi:transposase
MKKKVYNWVKRFSEGRETVTDEERLGRPAPSRTEEKRGVLCSQPRWFSTMRYVALLPR